MANQETREVAEYILLHLHMYEMCCIYIRIFNIYIIIHSCSILYVLELAHIIQFDAAANNQAHNIYIATKL